MKCNICRKKINEYMSVCCNCSDGLITKMCISCSNIHYCDTVSKKNQSKDFLKKKLEKVVAEKVPQI